MSRKACQCIKLVNEKLVYYNAVIETNWLDDPPRAIISLCKKEPRVRKKPPKMTATFCPFCGNRYLNKRRFLAKLDAALSAAEHPK